MSLSIKHVYIIAEAGSAHLGNIEKAKSLIDAAAEAGADCIKFQWIIADEIVHPKAGPILLHGTPVPIWERFKLLERPPEFYGALKEETEKRGLMFLCTPFGLQSAEGLRNLKVEAIKIASPELNHYPLLDAVTEFPLILSTGVSKLADIERSMEHLKNNDGPALLHCITAYPAPEEEYNLRVIPSLSTLFGTIVGVSDHSLHPYAVPALAVGQGAKIIEKHITLAHRGEGLDDPIALEPQDFKRMVDRVRAAERESSAVIIRELSEELGEERVEKILGRGIKKLAPSEEPFYSTSNRSIVALTDLHPGTCLNEENIALLRSEQKRSAGLPPHFLTTLMGKTIKHPVKAGFGITLDHFL